MAQGVPEPSVHVRVPAKINISLRVGPREPGGFHRLATVFQAVSLYDDVVVEHATPGEFSVVTNDDRVPDDDTNLAVRAARLLAERYAGDGAGAALSIRKTIPVAGGMAGGSADAAAALVGCAALWDLDLEPDELAVLAADLGSDVPFALLGGTAIGTGRGEELVPVLTRGCYHWVLAFGWGGLSTPDVYRRFDQLAGESVAPEVDERVVSALAAGDVVALGAALDNGLQAAAVDLRPDLRRTLDAGREFGALGAIVSGSGPTCAFLAGDEAAAVDLSVALSRSGLCTGAKRVTAPVPGARRIA